MPLSKRLVWIDSVVMGLVLVGVGVAVFLAATGSRYPLYLGILTLGVVFVAFGFWLTRKGLLMRPRETQLPRALGASKLCKGTCVEHVVSRLGS